MPMSSAQISQLTAQSQQMGMSQMQHAAMISQQAGWQGGSQNAALGQHMAGSAINTMSSVGGPAIQGGMALAGLDPLSMGIRGGMAGYAMGGAAGAVGGAALGMGAIGLPMMAGQYAWGQMTQGMQQQQQLRGQLGQAFQFQNAAGGRGFTGGEVETIGSQFRTMSQQRGPGGEQTSFAELSRLASNMGRMGMAQNVRSVQEFQDQFSKMIKNVKEVAKAMSTSLEEAQEMMSGMRSSGVFRNQGQVAQDIRGMAVGGGLATSEVTGMMRVGSQISRMIGGRGRAGADAGMQAIGLVGAAQQGGTLSEEDIYNQTGLTGAEGRRAMATGMLQTSARFMQSGLGRRFLASIAGKGGTVNEAQIREYMAGGVGTGDTMRMAHENLAKIGRADFIRNEGRLRGAAMGALGGLAPAMVMSGWLKQRGIDVNSDRARIMIQRRLGMGTDEADNMMKMIQGLPTMLETRQNKIEDAATGRRQQQARSHTNINRLKKKFEDARNSVQNTLRQLGADFQDEISDYAERFVNNITGDVVSRQAHDVAELTRGILRGGSQGELAAGRLRLGGAGDLGAAGDTLSQMGSQFGANLRRGQTQRGGHGYMARTNLNWLTGGMLKAGAKYESGMEATMKASGDWQRYKEAGFGLDEELGEESLQRQIASAHEISRRFMSGVRAGRKDIAGTRNTDKSRILREMDALGSFSGGGKDRVRAFKSAILASDKPELAALKERLKGARTDEEVSAIMGEEQAAAGMAEEGDIIAMQVPGMRSLFQAGGYTSERARDKAIGEAMFGKGGRTIEERVEASGSMLAGTRQEAGIRRRVVGRMTSAQQQMAARIVQSEEYLERSRGVLSTDENIRRKAVEETQRRMSRLQKKKGERGDADVADIEANRALLAAGKMRELAAKSKDGKVSEADMSRAAKDLNMDLDAFKDAAAGVEANASEQAMAERKRVMQAVGERGREDALKLTAAGFMDEKGNLTAAASERLSKIGDAAFKGMGPSLSTGEMVGRGIVEMKQLQQKMAETGPDGQMTAEAKKAFERYQQLQKEQRENIGKMTTEQKAQLGKFLAGTPGAEGLGGRLMDEVGIEKELKAARGPGGTASVVAGQLGLGKLTKEELKGTPDEIANRLVSKSQVGSEDAKKLKADLLAAITGKDSTGKPIAAGERAARVREARGITAGTAEKRAKAAEDEKEKQSPTFGILKEMAGNMKSIATALTGKEGQTVKVNVTVQDNDAEGGGQKTGSASSTAPRCFPAKVKVLMADGSEKPIKDVEPGDKVVSVDTNSGAPQVSMVLQTHVALMSDDIVEVNGVPATAYHPFFVNKEWVKAEDIELGDTIHRMKVLWGEPVPEKVESICRVRRDVAIKALGSDKVYNIEVATNHNYFADGVLVHNK